MNPTMGLPAPERFSGEAPKSEGAELTGALAFCCEG